MAISKGFSGFRAASVHPPESCSDPAKLLIICRKCFRLVPTPWIDAIDIRRRQLTRQQRVFRKVFKITPTQRRTLDIDARPKDDICLLLKRFFADRLADFAQ